MSARRRNSLSDLPQRPPAVSLETRADTGFDLSQITPTFFASTTDQQAQRATPASGSRHGSLELQEDDLTTNTDWEQKNLLTFDGGGIRGYATVLMLEKLMKYIGKLERKHPEPHQSSFDPHEKPAVTDEDDDGSYYSDYLPCHYFDYMVGTSTGGLIAVMLSRWRMTIQECRTKYEVFGMKVFAHRRKVSFLGLPHDKYHKAPLVNAIQDLVIARTPERSIGSDKRFDSFRAPNDLCRTAVVANEETSNRSSKGPYIFRSYGVGRRDNVPEYDLPRNHTDTTNHPILEVCRATTAAPTFFRPQKIGDKKYSDGALGNNNPTEEAIDEMHHVGAQYPKFVASFGTGKPAERSKHVEDAKKKLGLVRPFNLANNLFQTAKAGLTDCERTHKTVEKHALRDKVFEYFRFNIEEGLGKMKIDESKPTTFATIRRCAEKELEKRDVKNKLQALASELVKQRRERIRKHPSHWERFACCTTYECDAKCLDKDGKRRSFLTRHEMTMHLQTDHSFENEKKIMLEGRLNSCRRTPEFPAGPW